MKKAWLFCTISVLALMLGSFNANAQVVFPATTQEEFQALVASSPLQVTFIRTTQDWLDYKAGARFLGHPLKGLTAQQLADFAESVWLEDGGLKSLDLGILERNLTTEQVRTILGAFGISIKLAQDYKDYYCQSKGTCAPKLFYICTSNC